MSKPEYPLYQLDYWIRREDGALLTKADMDAIEDSLWDVIVVWLEERKLLLSGAQGPRTADDLPEWAHEEPNEQPESETSEPPIEAVS